MNTKRLLHKSFFGLALIGSLGILTVSGFSWAVEPPLSITDADPIPGRVLVRVKEGIPVEQVQKIAEGVGAEVDRVLAPWGLYLFRFDPQVPVSKIVQQLQSKPGVQYAEPDVRFQTSGALESDPYASSAGAGAPVIVAVIDTGMDLRHEAFTGRLYVNAGEIAGDGIDNDHNGYVDDVNGYDFYDHNGDPTGAAGDGAHGTMVAGRVLQGATDAPVALMTLRVGPGPFLTLSGIVEAIQYAVDRGARIINMSFGGGYSQMMADVVRYAADRGVLLVAAAGNSGTTLPSYPAALSNVVSVAASDATGRKTWWSNYGSSVDFTAPGSQVTTTTFGGGTAVVSGTSFSAPFVAGVAARILAALPNLTVGQVIDRLRSFAKDVYATNPFYYRGLLGRGLIDGEVAQRVADALPIQPGSSEPPPQDNRDQLQSELALARAEVARLENELSTAERNLTAAHDRVVEAGRQATAVEQTVRDAWSRLIETWGAWYKSGYGGPTSPAEREALRQKMQQAWDTLFKAFAARQDAQARLRAAQAEENRSRDIRNDLAARLRVARDRVDELNRRLNGTSLPLQSRAAGVPSQTQMLIKQLQQVMAAAQASPLPDGIDAQVVSDLSFPEVSSSLND